MKNFKLYLISVIAVLALGSVSAYAQNQVKVTGVVTSAEDGLPMKLDNIVAVVDCARMRQEFENGRMLMRPAIEEDDIENLLINGIEGVNYVLTEENTTALPEGVASRAESGWSGNIFRCPGRLWKRCAAVPPAV